MSGARELTAGREKRLLLGWMAFLAPIPLPFNQVLEWPVLTVYLGLVVWFLRRAAVDRSGWLPAWAMNLLGLFYLPVFLADLVLLAGRGLVRPVVHLALFAVVVKLFSLRRERDKWQTLVGIFFLFLAGMGTSIHPSVVVYLLAFLVLGLVLLARFAHLHLLAGFGRSGDAPAAVPLAGVMVLSVLLSVLMAIPLFALLPRINNPYLGQGVFALGLDRQSIGFSDEVTLDSIGRVRTNRQVALRIRFDDVERYLERQEEDFRLKAATFDVYRDDRWKRTERWQALFRGDLNLPFALAEQRPVQWAEVWLQPLRSHSLVLPPETVLVDGLEIRRLFLGRGGALRMVRRPSDVLRYQVGLAAEEVALVAPPEAEDSTLDPGGSSPAITDLATRVTGEGTSLERARQLERYFHTRYTYTLDFVGRSAEEPLEEFLFESRSGHCEYFATSMVVMLRSQGIPARLVTGFLGGEYNPFEGYFVVRQANAHAWVEAWIAEEGRWMVFDPTPPGGRPTSGRTTLLALLEGAYDYMLFHWDRWVVGYDFDDQISVFGELQRAWSAFWDGFRRGSEDDRPQAVPGRGDPETAVAALRRAAGWLSWPWLVGVVALLALAVGAMIVVRQLRRPLTPGRAYRRLCQALARAGLAVREVDPPLALRRAALARYPAAAEPAGRVFELYLQDTYAGRPLDEGQREELRASLRQAVRQLRRRD